MKKLIYKAGAALASLGILASCSSDYLDVLPVTSIPKEEVTASTQAAKMAIYGICSSMQTQYSATTYNQYNGESWVNTVLNDGFSQDVNVGLTQKMFNAAIYNWEQFEDDNLITTCVPWMYCYNIINQANVILDGIDEAEGTAAERAFIKAQALTFRAHGYVKLLQFYAPRWEDSKDGSTLCVVLRLHSNQDPMPLSSMSDVIAQIYKDLDDAIALYDESGATREYKWEPNKSVAQGLYARAALIKHDWSVAQKMAHDARNGFTVMDNNTYFAGFCYDNSDFMWIQSLDESNIYYWSWGSHYAVNGLYVKNWGIGSMAINLDLYNALDPNDVRRKMYVTPDKVHEIKTAQNPGKITEDDFWLTSLVDGSNLCNMASGPFAKKDAKDEVIGTGDDKVVYKEGVWGLYNVVLRYCKKYKEEIFTGSLANMIDDEGFCCYFKVGSKGDMSIGNDLFGSLVTIQLGAQLKFWSICPYGVSAYPFMRASEMCLAEAEAAYMAGDEATAQSCLREINGKRITNYAGPKSGSELLEEIRLCRRIELWGEGQGFSDFKRWNIPCVRREWVPRDPTSGNFAPGYGVTVQPQEHNGWRFYLPYVESDFNELVSPEQAGYTIGSSNE